MESHSIPASFRSQLHLRALTYTDRGQYFCVARNALGTDRSMPILLNVTYSPQNTRVVVSPPGDIREGYHVNLSCVSQANPPVNRYAWHRILGDKVWAKGMLQNMSFSSVRAHSAGQYYCTTWNRLGYQTSPVATLSVLYPPKNTSLLARPSSVVDAGRTLTLTCSSQANPAVDNFTWHRLPAEGVPRRGESGQYYCEARNRIGAHSSPVLTVRVKGRLKAIALASAVGVSAALITLTVAIMISKNMHRVDLETTGDVKKRPSVTDETVFYESAAAQQAVPLGTDKMSDIPPTVADLTARLSAFSPPAEQPVITMPSQLETAMESLIVVFHNYASKGGKAGTLNRKELRELMENELSSFLKSQKDPAAVDRIMHDLDANGDGEVNFEEFVSLVVGLSIACEQCYNCQLRTTKK
ncbi:hypothetical protein CRUP_021246 [Coryphaenoides rupestris]|nr:hypothetical protein CRUP_021246 [Coryphaenoides rupestris]